MLVADDCIRRTPAEPNFCRGVTYMYVICADDRLLNCLVTGL